MVGPHLIVAHTAWQLKIDWQCQAHVGNTSIQKNSTRKYSHSETYIDIYKNFVFYTVIVWLIFFFLTYTHAFKKRNMKKAMVGGGISFPVGWADKPSQPSMKKMTPAKTPRPGLLYPAFSLSLRAGGRGQRRGRGGGGGGGAAAGVGGQTRRRVTEAVRGVARGAGGS